MVDSQSPSERFATNRLAAIQRRQNQQTAGLWDCLADHRRRVAKLLLHWAHSDRRLCVLGAGNCNDLLLPELASRYSVVELVDLDEEALIAALQRQGVEPQRANVRIHGGVDLSGILNQLHAVGDANRGDDAAMDALVHQASHAPLELPGKYDVVVSLCLLSQLFDAAVQAFGASHPRMWHIIEALRERHLRLLADAVQPRGIAILITDIVSSETTPELPFLSDAALRTRVFEWIRAGNFFTGLNPLAVQRCIEEKILAPMGRGENLMSAPWRMDLGLRMYVVFAFVTNFGESISC